MKIKYIYWFSYYDLREPSVRYRALYALEELKKRSGINYTIIYPGYRFKNIYQFAFIFISLLFARKSNSLIVFQKLHTQRLYVRLLKLLLFFRKANTLYDTDDADYIRFPAQNIHFFMKNCAACSVGSHALKEYSHKFNNNVFLLTSPVIKHGKIKRTLNKVFTIGWVGYYNAHRDNLNQLFFPAILNIDYKIRLVLLGVDKDDHREEIKQYFSQNEYISVDIPENIDWQNELSIYDHIKEFDLGVSPLLNTKFNQAKSAFKLKQCLSCGVPVLASSVGENIHFLKHGINGYFCDSIDEYRTRVDAIKYLDEDQYSALSNMALQTASQFSIEKYCTELITSIAQYQ